MDYAQHRSLKEKLIKGLPIEEPIDKDPFDPENEDEDDEELEMECFRAGTHIDSQGKEETYTLDDIKGIADKYNEQKSIRPAPLIVGHSSMEAGKDDRAPSFGWGSSAEVRGNSLYMKFEQVSPEMKKLIKDGAYRNRSISLYNDGRIRHLAVLGAAQPALELKPVASFSEGLEYKTYEYKEQNMADVKTESVEDLKKELSFFQKVFNIFKVDVDKYKDHAESDPMKAAIAREQGSGAEVENAAEDKAETGEMEEQIEKETKGEKADPKQEVSKTAIAETKNEANEAQTEMTELKAQVAALTNQVTTLSEALKAKGEEMIKGGNREFCESLVKDGKLRPVDVDAVLATFEEKAYIDSIRNYSEEGKPSSVEAYKAFLSIQPKVVEFAEIVPMDAAVPVPTFAELVANKQKAKPELDYAHAMSEVCDENPEHAEVKSMGEYIRSMHD